MKKLLYLFAAVLLSFNAIAQDKNAAVQNLLKSSMVGLVDNARMYYKEGMTYAQFTTTISDSKALSKEESVVVTEVYNFLAAKTNTGDIFAKYDGKSLKNLAASGSSSGSVAVASRCGFKCWLQAIKDLIDIIIAVVNP
ncbi:hypothetical protein FNO01nite_06190 [Flavobacterium noncentrifugens]|uniref:DUF3347 domain-containing protein n=1 Tax=Flavobacterium noncentrifugens TaxID=1128970 RepID=A0A1G8SSC8_9FLAO|nr:hypothetical protein [Flavobacterium noncentrifugens]GEP49947.1 hypothetical protein FNO01nite_06190 [Flavobacterium noncentrifugens]SDJ32156.1 hypothetical protein SAMN04487935_0680 [Flavobacterium noncentrifugens]